MLTIGLAQSGYPQDGDVLAQVEAFAGKAAEAGVQLLVFPENLMSPRPLEAPELRELAEPLDGPFARALAKTAQTHGLWIVFTQYETNPAGGPPFNTAVVVDQQGTRRGSYQKCHLYDAHDVRESDRMSAGASLCAPITTPFGTLGLGICYDLRFPELARAAAVAGCDLVLFPACWHDGPHKRRHWETLLRARAIENECFVAGICHAGEKYVEQSMVVDPLGCDLELLAHPVEGHPQDKLLVAELDLAAVGQARDAMPILAQRRPWLYDA